MEWPELDISKSLRTRTITQESQDDTEITTTANSLNTTIANDDIKTLKMSAPKNISNALKAINDYGAIDRPKNVLTKIPVTGIGLIDVTGYLSNNRTKNNFIYNSDNKYKVNITILHQNNAKKTTNEITIMSKTNSTTHIIKNVCASTVNCTHSNMTSFSDKNYTKITSQNNVKIPGNNHTVIAITNITNTLMKNDTKIHSNKINKILSHNDSTITMVKVTEIPSYNRTRTTRNYVIPIPSADWYNNITKASIDNQAIISTSRILSNNDAEIISIKDIKAPANSYSVTATTNITSLFSHNDNDTEISLNKNIKTLANNYTVITSSSINRIFFNNDSEIISSNNHKTPANNYSVSTTNNITSFPFYNDTETSLHMDTKTPANNHSVLTTSNNKIILTNNNFEIIKTQSHNYIITTTDRISSNEDIEIISNKNFITSAKHNAAVTSKNIFSVLFNNNAENNKMNKIISDNDTAVTMINVTSNPYYNYTRTSLNYINEVPTSDIMLNNIANTNKQVITIINRIPSNNDSDVIFIKNIKTSANIKNALITTDITITPFYEDTTISTNVIFKTPANDNAITTTNNITSFLSNNDIGISLNKNIKTPLDNQTVITTNNLH